MKSPCFIHSLLDKSVSVKEWLQHSKVGHNVDVAPSLGDAPISQLQSQKPLSIEGVLRPDYLLNQTSPPSSYEGGEDEDEDDEDGGGSLTKQLAETAVSVREISKQLGRARIKSNINSVMIITKARDNRLIKLTRELALYLMTKQRPNGRGLIVYVDSQLRRSKRFDAEGLQREYPELFVPVVPSPKRRSSSSTSSIISIPSDEFKRKGNDEPKETGQLRYWTSDMCSKSPHLFDFVVTLGGDGTVLFTSWLFQRIVPPVLSFALGSLGFLTNFDFVDHQAVMDSAIDSGIRVNLRMRFTCTVYRAVAPEEGRGSKAVKKADTGEIMMNIEKGGWEAIEGGSSSATSGHSKHDKEIMCFTTRPVETFEVINDLVVDRGPSPYVSLLELFGDEHHMTTVQADGLCVATPTGSTAYSLSAGGSLVHPEIPALLISPICPHTLSFRPMLLPDSMELRICVPYNSRSTAWASFDGRGRVELKQGDHIKVTASRYPFPTVCADKQSTDWFSAISRTLKWNERERQKSFVVVEEGPAKKYKKSHKEDESGRHLQKLSSKLLQEELPEEVPEDDEEDEEKFDIDDSSPEAASSSNSVEDKRVEAKQNISATPTSHINLPSVNRHAHSTSGIDSPNRFAVPYPHPPSLRVSPLSSEASTPREREDRGDDGDRDHINAPLTARESSRSKIPLDRDVDGESATTPRAHEHARKHAPHMHRPHNVQHQLHPQYHPHHYHHSNAQQHHGASNASGTQRRTRSLSVDGGRRAFAVWGHDESDSNASDSDA